MERRRRGADQPGQGPQPSESRDDIEAQDGAFLDRHDLGREVPVEAEHHPLFGLAGAEGRAAARPGRAGDDLVHGADDSLRSKRLRDLLALPGAIVFGAHMLQRTAAAGAEMPARRLDAERRRLQHGHEVGTVLVARRRHRLARQGVGNENVAAVRAGDAVALRGKPVDDKTRAHRSFTPPSRNSRLPSPPSIGDGTKPSARQPD
jgi:hypothetical protein